MSVLGIHTQEPESKTALLGLPVRRWGEMYGDAIDAAGYRYQTLRNAAWVVGRYDLSSRKDNLSYSHRQRLRNVPTSGRSVVSPPRGG